MSGIGSSTLAVEPYRPEEEYAADALAKLSRAGTPWEVSPPCPPCPALPPSTPAPFRMLPLMPLQSPHSQFLTPRGCDIPVQMQNLPLAPE
jgi:hypothetical protein